MVSLLEEKAKTLSSLAVSLWSKQFQNIYVTDPWKTGSWSSHDSMKDCLLMASLVYLNLTASLCQGPALKLLMGPSAADWAAGTGLVAGLGCLAQLQSLCLCTFL